MKKGFDTNVDLTTFATPLFNLGYNFAGRYYNIRNLSKNLTLSEAQVLSSAGLAIVAIWEDGSPTNVGYFSYDAGVRDATAAYQYASAQIGQPALTPIYFTVDYDASEDDVAGSILDYFKGVQAGFSAAGSQYLIGVYGSGLTCQSLLDAHIATFTWLSQSTGWRGSSTFTNYNIAQSAEITECPDQWGVNGDPNTSPNDTEGSFSI